MVAGKSVVKNESNGYVCPNGLQSLNGFQDQNETVSTSTVADQYFYPPVSTVKPEKKSDSFVFNFAKGSMPTIHIKDKS